MAKSSTHIEPVKRTSEIHNQRRTKIPLSYLNPNPTLPNESEILESISEVRELIKWRHEKATGQKMQKNATPIRETVINLNANHTLEDLKLLNKAIEERFGIRAIQTYIHRDEGHYVKDTGKWKDNFHAHVVYDFSDRKTAKSIKLNRSDMSEMQDIVAEVLQMERGVKSSRKHLSAIAYKVEQEEKKLQEVQIKLKRAQEIVNAEQKVRATGFFTNPADAKAVAQAFNLQLEKQKDVEELHREEVERLKSEAKTSDLRAKKEIDELSDKIDKINASIPYKIENEVNKYKNHISDLQLKLDNAERESESKAREVLWIYKDLNKLVREVVEGKKIDLQSIENNYPDMDVFEELRGRENKRRFD